MSRASGSSGTSAEWDELAHAFDQWCAAHVGQACELALSGRFLLTSFCAQGADPAQARQQALDQWGHYMDLDEAILQNDWALRQVGLPGTGSLVCAAPVALLSTLKDVADAHGVRLLWVGPWWARGLQDWLHDALNRQHEGGAGDAELSLREDGLHTRVQIGQGDDGRPAIMRLWAEWQPADLSQQGAGHAWLSPERPQQRGVPEQSYHACLWDLALTSGNESPPVLPSSKLGGLRVWRKADWARALDFVGPRVRTSVFSWLALMLGLVAASLLLPELDQLEQDRLDAQASVQRLQRAAHQQSVAARAPASIKDDAKGRGQAATDAPPLGPDSAPRAAQLALWLGYPWMAVMQQIESTAQVEHAVMLSFSLDTASLGSKAGRLPDIRVSAAVQDDHSALRWAQAQGPAAQLLNRERLSTPFTAAAGAYEWRVEAVWSGEAP